MSHSQTLVTCLYDLKRREKTCRRSIDFYFQHGELVLDLELPLIIFTDPGLAMRIQAERERRGLSTLTEVVELPLEELPLHTNILDISSLPTFLNHDPIKDTHLHQLIEWSKFDLLELSIHKDPFNSGYFTWIDFGIGHMATAPQSFPAANEKISLLQLRALALEEFNDKYEILRYERGIIAAGLIRGSKAAHIELITSFRKELNQVLELNFRPNEQMILAYLTVKRPELFDLYYGDYPSILCNWDHIRENMGAIFLNLAYCRLHHLYQQGFEITEKAIQDFHACYLHLSREQSAQLLDEAIIAAWYCGRHSTALIRCNEFLNNCIDTHYFRDNKIRLLKNIELVKQHSTRH